MTCNFLYDVVGSLNDKPFWFPVQYLLRGNNLNSLRVFDSICIKLFTYMCLEAWELQTTHARYIYKFPLSPVSNTVRTRKQILKRTHNI